MYMTYLITLIVLAFYLQTGVTLSCEAIPQKLVNENAWAYGFKFQLKVTIYIPSEVAFNLDKYFNTRVCPTSNDTYPFLLVFGY